MEPLDVAWTESPAPVSLDPGELQVWRFPVDIGPRELDHCFGRLSDQERRRADRFARTDDRNRFTVARAGLRLLLGHHLGVDPAVLAFAAGPHGKPRLAGPDHADAPEFNVSHAGAWALVALASGGPVGVDLESSDRDLDPDAVADRVLAPEEIAALDRFRDAAKTKRFLEIWTVKEAVVKVLGRGISFPLSSFAVEFPGAGKVRLSGPGATGDLADIAVAPLVPGPGYVGAAAVRGTGFRLRTISGAHLVRPAPLTDLSGGKPERNPG